MLDVLLNSATPDENAVVTREQAGHLMVMFAEWAHFCWRFGMRGQAELARREMMRLARNVAAVGRVTHEPF